MALSISSIDSGGTSGGAATTQATATKSPAGGSLLIIWCCFAVTGGTTISSISDTFTGTSAWTQQKSLSISSSTRIDVWTATAGASPGSGAATIHFAAGCSNSYDFDQ